MNSNLQAEGQEVKQEQTQEDDEVKLFISCNDHDTLLFLVTEE